MKVADVSGCGRALRFVDVEEEPVAIGELYVDSFAERRGDAAVDTVELDAWYTGVPVEPRPPEPGAGNGPEDSDAAIGETPGGADTSRSGESQALPRGDEGRRR